MTKARERDYFKAMDGASLAHAVGKPYSDAEAGILVAQMAAALQIFPHAPQKLLDLGCGTGWTSRFFAQAGYAVTGYELSPEAVKIADSLISTELKSKLKFICGDYEKLPFENEFDCALFIDSLHHSQDETKVLRQVFKALKPGGICIAIEPGKGHSRTAKSHEAIRRYGVTERDLPPKVLAVSAKQAGFAKAEAYVHPGQIFRALYNPPNKASGLKKRVLSSQILRSMLALQRMSLDRLGQGLVVLTK